MLADRNDFNLSKTGIFVALCGLGLMMMASLFTAIGFVTAQHYYSGDGEQQAPVILKADSANSGRSISFATGLLARDVDGLFVLDHLTGDLQCWLLNPKTGEMGGIYRTNVIVDLGTQKAGDTDFVMVTSRIDTTGLGQEANLRPAASICYVGDGNSGKVVAYGLRIDRQALLQGDILQEGTLEVVARGLSRGVVERDQ